MNKTKKFTGHAEDMEKMAVVPLSGTENLDGLRLFSHFRNRATGNDTCAHVNGCLDTTHAVLTVDIVGMGTCKILQTKQRGDWIDLLVLNNQNVEFKTSVLWHTKFDFYFGIP